MADGSFSDNIQLGDDLTGEYSQQGNLGVEASDIIDVSNFTKLAESAKDAGDEWTKGANYFMALHAADSSDTTGGTTGGSGSTPQNQGSTIGLLLSTSVGLQKLNMKFNVVKGIIEAVAAKAVTIAQDIAGAARGR